MTMDQSLRVRRGAASSRSVLTRAERIAQLQKSDRFAEGQSPLGLPKVRVYKLSMKKKKKAKDEVEAGAEGAAAPAAGAAAPAAGKAPAGGKAPAAAAKAPAAGKGGKK